MKAPIKRPSKAKAGGYFGVKVYGLVRVAVLAPVCVLALVNALPASKGALGVAKPRPLNPEGNPTWRFMGSYTWGYKSLNLGYNYGYPSYNPTYNYP